MTRRRSRLEPATLNRSPRLTSRNVGESVNNRPGVHRNWEILGVRQGYRALIDGLFTPLGTRDVGGIIQRGGTILGSARAPEFEREDVRRAALAPLEQQGIEALAIIGGNGSQAGVYALSEMGVPVVGLRYLGVLLMGALIIIPAATAKRLAANLQGMLYIAVGVAVVATMLGSWTAAVLHRETGPLIVSVATAFLVSLVRRPL